MAETGSIGATSSGWCGHSALRRRFGARSKEHSWRSWPSRANESGLDRRWRGSGSLPEPSGSVRVRLRTWSCGHTDHGEAGGDVGDDGGPGADTHVIAEVDAFPDDRAGAD